MRILSCFLTVTSLAALTISFAMAVEFDHYFIKSTRKIGNLIHGPWDQPVVRLFGNTTTVGTVEHKILRIKYTYYDWSLNETKSL